MSWTASHWAPSLFQHLIIPPVFSSIGTNFSIFRICDFDSCDLKPSANPVDPTGTKELGFFPDKLRAGPRCNCRKKRQSDSSRRKASRLKVVRLSLQLFRHGHQTSHSSIASHFLFQGSTIFNPNCLEAAHGIIAGGTPHV